MSPEMTSHHFPTKIRVLSKIEQQSQNGGKKKKQEKKPSVAIQIIINDIYRIGIGAVIPLPPFLGSVQSALGLQAFKHLRVSRSSSPSPALCFQLATHSVDRKRFFLKIFRGRRFSLLLANLLGIEKRNLLFVKETPITNRRDEDQYPLFAGNQDKKIVVCARNCHNNIKRKKQKKAEEEEQEEEEEKKKKKKKKKKEKKRRRRRRQL